MKKLGSAVIVGTTATLVVFFLAHAQQAEAPAPQYFPKESWAYDAVEKRDPSQSGSRSGFASGTYKVEVLEDGTLNLDPIFAGVMPSIYEGSATKSGIEWYRFPLKAGGTYQTKWESRGWFYGTVTVVAKEAVTVPAGNFEAYKLVLEASRGVSSFTWEYYFAPAAKAAVKIVQTQSVRNEVLVTRDVKLTSFSVRN